MIARIRSRFVGFQAARELGAPWWRCLRMLLTGKTGRWRMGARAQDVEVYGR